MTSIPSLAAGKKGCTGCKRDTVVCLMTFGCPLRPVYRKVKPPFWVTAATLRFLYCTEKQDNSKSLFSDRFGTKRRKVQGLDKQSLESCLRTINIQETSSTMSQALLKMPRGKKKRQKSCHHGAYILIKLTLFTILGKIFNFLGFFSYFNKSLFTVYSMPGNRNIITKGTYSLSSWAYRWNKPTNNHKYAITHYDKSSKEKVSTTWKISKDLKGWMRDDLQVHEPW